MVKHAHSRRAGSLRLARTGSDEKDDEDVEGEEKTGKAGKRRERGRVRKGTEKSREEDWQQTLKKKGKGAQKRQGKATTK